MSIHPVNKAAEHLINSTPVGGGGEKKEAINAYLIRNSKGDGRGGGDGGGGGTITGSRKDWAEYYVTVHPMQLLQGVHEVYA